MKAYERLVLVELLAALEVDKYNTEHSIPNSKYVYGADDAMRFIRGRISDVTI
jgi:hypothetical protein